MENAKKRFIMIFYAAVLFIMGAANKTAMAAITVKVTNPIATSNFNKLVSNVLQWTLSVAGSIALVMLIIGGITYITASGNEERVNTGKKIITWTIIGLAIVLVSYAIMSVINRILTVP